MSAPAAEPLSSEWTAFPAGVRDVLARARENWLKNTEVCDLLVHFRTYGLPICRHPPHRPPGGSVFLFDRRAVRFFRKDGHSWRKKADGKTVRETHEKLKVGNVDMLNCYYAHGDEAEDIKLQRRCYWLLEADEDIVLVHYLSANQLAGGARKGGGRAAISQSTSDEQSEGTPTTSSDGSGWAAIRQRPSLESPFLAKARVANAQSQAAIASALASRNMQHQQQQQYSGRMGPPAELLLGRGQRNAARNLDRMNMPPPPAQSPLGSRPAAIAAAAAGNPGYSGMGKDSMLIEGHMPLLPSMSLDSFMNFVDLPGGGVTVTDNTPQPPQRLQRQGSDPLRLESLANQWDEEGAVPMVHGRLPSLHMNPSLQSNSIALLDGKDLDPDTLVPSTGLPSLRVPSGADGFAQYLRSSAGTNTTPGGLRPHSLKTLSGVLPRMHVVTNSDRSSMDFQNNRSFVVRPATPGQWEDESPGFTSGLVGAEHLQGGWDPTIGHGPSSWDNMAVAPANVPVPPALPRPPAGLMVHQGGARPSQAAAAVGQSTFYSPFAAHSLQPQQRQQQQRSPHQQTASPYMQQQMQSAHSLQQQHSQALSGMSGMETVPAPAEQDVLSRPQSAQQQSYMSEPQPTRTPGLSNAAHLQASEMSGATSGVMPRQSSCALHAVHRQGSDAAISSPAYPAPAEWVPDSGAEDIGGSKARHAPSRSAVAVEAELSALQQQMLNAWQPPSGGPPPPPLSSQLGAWEMHLNNLEANAPPPASMNRAHSGGMPETEGLDASRSIVPAFRVTDFSPEWDMTAGGAKLLLTGSLLPGAPSEAQRGPLFLMFDHTQVAATVVQPGVLRATVPPHAPGVVKLSVSLGDGVPRSRPLPFEYRIPPPLQASEDDSVELQLPDKELQVRLIRMLLNGRGAGSSTGNISPEGPSATAGGDAGQQQRQSSAADGQQHQNELDPACLDEEQRSRYMTLLLQREVRRRASQAQGTPGADSHAAGSELDVVPRGGLPLVHLFAALGQEWGVTALLLAGASANTRDAWGRTPLHWAAARGHQAAVAALLTRKADPSLLTWAIPRRAPLTAAGLAARAGHAGIAAFLAEQHLQQLMLRLKPDSRRDALAAAAAAVSEPEDGGAHRKRTREQRSLYPSSEVAAAEEAEHLTPLERAGRAATALSEAHSKVVQRKLTRERRRSRDLQREAAAVMRINGWAVTWQQAEGRTLGATPGTIHRFHQLVARTTQLGTFLRASLEHGEADGSGRNSIDAGSTETDPASGADLQQILDEAVKQIESLETDKVAEAQYQQLAEAVAVLKDPLAVNKYQRTTSEDEEPILLHHLNFQNELPVPLPHLITAL